MTLAVATKAGARSRLYVFDGMRIWELGRDGHIPRFAWGFGIITGPERYAGRFMVPKWQELISLLKPGEDRRKFKFRSKHLGSQMVGNVFTALRQTEHILRKYGLHAPVGEAKLMQEASRVAHEMNVETLTAEGNTYLNLRDHAEELMRRIRKPNAELHNLPKREAYDQLNALRLPLDSRGRANPSAKAARTVALERRFEERLREIMRIDPLIAHRARALVSLIQAAESELDAFEDFLKEILKSTKLQSTEIALPHARVTIQLNWYARKLQAISYNPYRTFAIETARDISRANVVSNPDSREKFDKVLTRCLNALKVKRAQVEIERLIWMFTDALLKRNNEKLLQHIRERLSKVTDILGNIDESSFRKPICGEAIKYLKTAEFNFANPSPLSRNPNQHLKNAREAMKLASRALV